METVTVNGLVVRETAVGESDKILSVLTGEYGKIAVSAKGSKSLRSRHMTTTQLFCYSSFTLYHRGEYYYINDSELLEAFFEIRADIVSLALANYICEAASSVTVENMESSDILRLALNTLYAMSKRNRQMSIIKGAYELRLACLSGFAPNLVACSECAAYSSPIMFLDIMNGSLLCGECHKLYSESSDTEMDTPETEYADGGFFKIMVPISEAVLSAMRYVIYSKPEKFLSFMLDESEIKSFADICEKYLLNHLQRGFYSLDFYKSVAD